MTPLTFFRASLLLPILVPLLVLPAGVNAASVVLALSLAFGGVQYAAFAVAMFFLLGKVGTTEKMLRLCTWAPILFLPLLIGGWLLHAIPQGYGVNWGDLLPFIAYDFLLGYIYVGVCLVAYTALRSRGLVRE